MVTLQEHLAQIRQNWADMSFSFDSQCVNLVRGHMAELEALASRPDFVPALADAGSPRPGRTLRVTP